MGKQLRKLDRTKPFGEVYGSGDARFEQDHIQFDGNDLELPGFEDVIIPEKSIIIIDDPAGRAELVDSLKRLTEENNRLHTYHKGVLEDVEAEKEGLQGRIDTLEIEVDRLQKQLTETQTENTGLLNQINELTIQLNDAAFGVGAPATLGSTAGAGAVAGGDVNGSPEGAGKGKK